MLFSTPYLSYLEMEWSEKERQKMIMRLTLNAVFQKKNVFSSDSVESFQLLTHSQFCWFMTIRWRVGYERTMTETSEPIIPLWCVHQDSIISNRRIAYYYYEEQETILDAEILDLFAFWIVTIHRDTQQQSSNLHLLQPC